MICIKCSRGIPDDAALCCYCGRKFVREKAKRLRANGMGTAYKRGKTWTASVTVGWKAIDLGDGKKKLLPIKRTKGGFVSKKEALEFCPQLRGMKTETRLTLEMQYQAWEGSLKFTKLSKSKQTAYRIAYGRLTPIKNMPIGDIRLEDIQPIINGIGSYYPARDVKQVLSHLFKLAVVDGRADKNYADFIELPSMPKSKKDAFTAAEVKALWADYKTSPFTGYILLMIYTGMALGELQNVKRSNIKLQERQIIDVGTKNALRNSTPIFLADIIIPVVQHLYMLSASSEKLLNMNEDNFYAAYYATLERAGCRRLTPHCCRHTTATALAEAGIQPAIIKTIMRHSNYQTTTGYTHIDTQTMVNALNTMLAIDNLPTTSEPEILAK